MVACLLLGRLAGKLHSLSTGKYITRQEDIYVIDTFRSSGHVHIHTANRGTRLNEFNFYADRYGGRFRFTIETSAYNAVMDKESLTMLVKDTGHLFTVYSTKKALEQYRETEKAFAITVEQVAINGEQFIDTGLANEKRKRSLKGTVIMDALLLAVIGIVSLVRYFRKRRLKNAECL